MLRLRYSSGAIRRYGWYSTPLCVRDASTHLQNATTQYRMNGTWGCGLRLPGRIRKPILAKTEASHAYRAGGWEGNQADISAQQSKITAQCTGMYNYKGRAESHRLAIDQPISEGLPSPDILSFRRGSQQKNHVDMFSVLFFIQTADWVEKGKGWMGYCSLSKRFHKVNNF